MKYRKMGSLPWEVSALGFGCMRLPTSKFLPIPNEKKAIEIIRHGIDRGINYLDTAWLYPQSEAIVGGALKNGYREKVHVATKLPMILLRKKDDFDRYLGDSLKRMHVDCIDIYLFHMLNQSLFAKVKKFDLVEKMEQAKKAGKIKHIGFSFHDTLPVFKEIIAYYPWEITLVQYNYMDSATQATTEGLHYAHSKGVAVVVMEPLKGGQLVNPPTDAKAVMNSSKIKRSPTDWALQFLWNCPDISCVLSGMGSRKMVDENCTSADLSGVNTLSENDQVIIGNIAEVYRKKIVVPCTACKYCMPCPAGVNIPQNFALLNNKSLASFTNSAIGLSLRNITGRITQWLITRNYKKLSKKKTNRPAGPTDHTAINDNGRASLCTKCNACLPKCPQKIDIPRELEKVVSVFEKGKSVGSL
jgi:uncharacterized protein